MTSYTNRLPTLDKLGASIAKDLDVRAVAETWFSSFKNAVSARSIDDILGLFAVDALWRDILALTWDFRTFDGIAQIKQFLADRLDGTGMQCSQLGKLVVLQKPFPDLAWILALFEFETEVGLCSGAVRLIPTANGEWKAFTMSTNLENLKVYPERVGPLRDVSHKSAEEWLEGRRQEQEFKNNDPPVLIIGAGHCGLEMAARLKFLGVQSLVVDSHPHIGDSWRVRYDALCLHWPVWYDHMPYIPFPPTWPKYSPSWKIAEWLESYAKALDLNVWNSTTVLKARPVANADHRWSVDLRCADGSTRTMTTRHLVFATGVGGGYPKVPQIAGADIFRGKIMHSFQYKNAKNHIGEKAIVVGCGNSGHDVAADLARNGIDVTMYQRSSTFVMNLDKQWKFLGGALYSETSMPLEQADRVFTSMPHLLAEGGMAQRQTKAIMAGDKDLLDKLRGVGFRLNSGIKDAGVLLLLKSKGGGHYFNVGASEMIISGKIKLKNDTDAIACFTETGLKFVDGSELPADLVVFATGVGKLVEPIAAICGEDVAALCKPIGGVDVEGESRGIWRDIGVPGLWYANGPLQVSRLYSKHLALQIKAMEAGVFGDRYSL